MQPGLTMDRHTAQTDRLRNWKGFLSCCFCLRSPSPPSQPHHCLINPTTGDMNLFTAQFTVHALCQHNTSIIQIMSDGIKYNFRDLKSRHLLGTDEKYWPTQSCTRVHPSEAYLCMLVAKTNYCCLSWGLMTWKNKVVKKEIAAWS